VPPLSVLTPADGGFRGSPIPGPGHLPSTYTALCALALLRAPLDRLDRPGLMRFLRACQAADGSFSPSPGVAGAFQNDTRMSYCAAVTRAVALSGGERIEDIDVGKARAFLGRCRVSPAGRGVGAAGAEGSGRGGETARRQDGGANPRHGRARMPPAQA
jgi:geranylgeranyl transferase type-1 subunit beta